VKKLRKLATLLIVIFLVATFPLVSALSLATSKYEINENLSAGSTEQYKVVRIYNNNNVAIKTIATVNQTSAPENGTLSYSLEPAAIIQGLTIPPNENQLIYVTVTSLSNIMSGVYTFTVEVKLVTNDTSSGMTGGVAVPASTINGIITVSGASPSISPSPSPQSTNPSTSPSPSPASTLPTASPPPHESSPSPSSSPSEGTISNTSQTDTFNLAPIVAGAIGIAAFLILTVVVVSKRLRKSHEETDGETEEEETRS